MAKNGALGEAETSSVTVAKAELARKILRDAGEEVRSSFPHESAGIELVLIDVDPHRLHAFWTIPVALMEDARARPGGAGAAMVLRVFPSAEGGEQAGRFFDVEVGGLKGRAYVEVWQPERRYTASLGLRTGAGELIAFANSNEIALPPVGPVPERAPPAEPLPAAEPAPGEEIAAGDDPFPQLFDLEAVLPVSSYILAGDSVAFEATAELHIHGHAQPGSTVRLFGREVPVRPDGSFSAVHVLDHASPLLASILAAAAAEPKDEPKDGSEAGA
jgi:hypothetical protein